MPEDRFAQKTKPPLYWLASEHPPTEMAGVLNRFLDTAVPLGFLLGGIALMVSLLRSYQNGWHATGVLHIAIYAFAMLSLFLRNRISKPVVLYLLMGSVAVIVAHSLFALGLASSGMMILSLLCVFLSIFFGAKGGLVSAGTGALAVAAIGAGVCSGFLHMPPNVAKVLSSPATWLIQLLLFLLFTIPLILLIHHMQKKITNGLHALTEANRQLQLEIQKKADVENNLRESESRYRSIVENTLVAFSIVQDGRFRFVNPRYCDLTGYSYEELVDNMGPEDVATADARNKVTENCRRLLAGEPVSKETELTIVKKDGTAIPLKAMGGRFTYMGKPAIFTSLIDMTNEKLLESKLIQSQKMEAIGTLAGGIAHDFNNILSALMGFATMLHMALEDKDPLKRYTTNILSASEKAAGLTQSLLTFSRTERIELKPVKINMIIRDTEDLLRRVITEDIDFDINLAPEPTFIRADAIQINQILFNLVANAMDAMPRGGRLEISTGIEDLDEAFIVRNGFGKKGRYCRISVQDTGTGMDPAIAKKIFDPFFTTKDIGKGTGLGLSTVYGIVKQHHGYIQVSSALNEGTAFHIYFPAISESSRVEYDALKNFRKGNETILVAEDDKTTRSFINDLLTHYGYRVIEAGNGEEAICKFQENPGISLLILDAVMPGKNGKEVYDAVHQRRPGMPALFMSGYPRETVLAKGLLAPSMAFISKPLYPDQFMERVGAVLEEKN